MLYRSDAPSKRLGLLKEVVARYPASRYEIAKSAGMPTSTAYYELAHLERDGYVAVDEDGIVHPRLKGLVKYVAAFGCDTSVMLAAKHKYGIDFGPGLCKLLNKLTPYWSVLNDNLLEALLKLAKGPEELVELARQDEDLADTIAKIIAEYFPAFNYDGHKGLLIVYGGDVLFAGYCKLCARYVVDRCKLFEPTFNYKETLNKA